MAVWAGDWPCESLIASPVVLPALFLQRWRLRSLLGKRKRPKKAQSYPLLTRGMSDCAFSLQL